LEGSWGGFYGGTRNGVEAGLTLKPNKHILLAVGGERNDVSLPAGHFTTDVLSVKVDYNFSPNVFWANLVQYDSESRLLGVQSRFRWILKPGNDLFLVINRGWLRDFTDRYIRQYDRASAKLQYTFRL
jgi:hypothetical protein